MSSSPKSSLVERLVRDRLRSGDLEASAAQLLQLGDGMPPGDAAIPMVSDAPAGTTSGDTVIDSQVRLPPVPPPPNATTPPDIRSMGPTSLSTTSLGTNSLGTSTNGTPPTNPLSHTAQSFETLPPGPAAGPSAPVALELRPLMDPTPRPTNRSGSAGQ